MSVTKFLIPKIIITADIIIGNDKNKIPSTSLLIGFMIIRDYPFYRIRVFESFPSFMTTDEFKSS